MITIGVDAHKHLHVAVAVDAVGHMIAQWRGPNSAEDWAALAAWALPLGAPRCWGIEGAGNYGRGLAQHLVIAGETVYDINPRWTAEERQRERSRSKNDVRDALAIAHRVQREGTRLPRCGVEDETTILALRTTERDNALAEATRLRNQLHQLLTQLDPAYRLHLPSLRSRKVLPLLRAYTTDHPSLVQQERAASVRRLAHRLALILEQIDDLTRQIETLATERFSPLMRLRGVKGLTAGALAGILGPGRRFATEAHLAAYAGVAPLEVSSAGRLRHRLNRGGNRQLNALLHHIVLTQLRCAPEAHAYVARRMSEGKTKREAIRALKRFLIRSVWRLWQECVRLAEPIAQPDAA